jgi:ABC transport system ATP-binding/permease protein
MIEPILKALIRLFALISDVRDISEISSRERDIVRLFLSRQLNNEMVVKYMEMFDEYLIRYSAEKIVRGTERDKKRTSLTAVKILGICEQINEELQQKQKIYVLVQLMDFILFGAEITENELEFLETVSNAFNVSHDEFHNIRQFILGSTAEIPQQNRLMLIDSQPETSVKQVNHLYRENLVDTIYILHIESINAFILKYSGKGDLLLNGQNIFPGQTYMFDHGSTLRGSGISAVYYNDVSKVFTEETLKLKVSLDAVNVSLKFKNSELGIQNFEFHEESGNLVGILGGSGVGKTTLLNLLSGITKPGSGEVLINGINIYSEEGSDRLRGIIGFVPQDDLLIEELTVFQNLYYSAKMCLDNLSEKEIEEVVNRTLVDLDLDLTRDLKVGNSLNKVISGGQRKRLNIALELIREPAILFVDEPTSGLSSVDSEVVMNLLKEQTDRGKLVIVNIHQPGSDLYKMFDKIMIIDKGGYQIFYGNPSEAIVYFKTRAGYANADEDQCEKCGNVNSDQLLQIIEAKVVNENGKQSHIRKVSPQQWAMMFREASENSSQSKIPEVTDLPENNFSIPGLLKQSKIYFIRDVLSKLANRQYLMISIFGAPLLAFLLAWFTKYNEGDRYIFSENENLPSYLFMCVITSLFLGLIISAEEIVRDRKILKRESFLNLSWFSYLNSKVMIMFLISAVQTISFILIGNYILEIKGMTFSYWLVLFTTSCFANILGLNISSGFNSVITIYILIPFIIIPQLLFSGVLVKFDKLHQISLTSGEYTPIIGDMMAARWSFEALAVEQFKNNKYERNFFEQKAGESENTWYGQFLIDELKNDLWKLNGYKSDKVVPPDDPKIKRLRYHIAQLSTLAKFGSVPDSLKAELDNFSPGLKENDLIGPYLKSLKSYFNSQVKKYSTRKDSVTATMTKDELKYLHENYYNSQLEKVVLDKLRLEQNLITDDRIIRKYEPGYMKPSSKFGRAHLYAPYKQVGNISIDTYWFDLAFLWVVSLLLYIALYYNLLQRVVNISVRIKVKETGK